jgi:muconate cycloisomerase
VSHAAKLDIYTTRLPMRRFEHAAADRDSAQAVLVRLELSGGDEGFGETLPREYVTGETIDTVVASIQHTLWPALREQVIETDMSLPPLPDSDAAGKPIPAALCAVELAALDAVGRPMRRPIAARVSGVLGSSDPARTAKQLRLMRWFALRDFKLKLGLGEDADAANLDVVAGALRRGLRAGSATLRVDVNGGWSARQTPQKVSQLARMGVCVVEQPVFCRAGELARLAKDCELPLMADESLITEHDAHELLAEPARVWWNIRISKNGGLLRAIALADLAAQHGVNFTVGAMVGESGILSAAQRRLLQCVPPPRFVEGNYGRFLLGDDLTKPSPRMGYGGRLRALNRPGLGVRVDGAKLRKYGKLVASLR